MNEAPSSFGFVHLDEYRNRIKERFDSLQKCSVDLNRWCEVSIRLNNLPNAAAKDVLCICGPLLRHQYHAQEELETLMKIIYDKRSDVEGVSLAGQVDYARMVERLKESSKVDENLEKSVNDKDQEIESMKAAVLQGKKEMEGLRELNTSLRSALANVSQYAASDAGSTKEEKSTAVFPSLGTDEEAKVNFVSSFQFGRRLQQSIAAMSGRVGKILSFIRTMSVVEEAKGKADKGCVQIMKALDTHLGHLKENVNGITCAVAEVLRQLESEMVEKRQTVAWINARASASQRRSNYLKESVEVGRRLRNQVEVVVSALDEEQMSNSSMSVSPLDGLKEMRKKIVELIGTLKKACRDDEAVEFPFSGVVRQSTDSVCVNAESSSSVNSIPKTGPRASDTKDVEDISDELPDRLSGTTHEDNIVNNTSQEISASYDDILKIKHRYAKQVLQLRSVYESRIREISEVNKTKSMSSNSHNSALFDSFDKVELLVEAREQG